MKAIKTLLATVSLGLASLAAQAGYVYDTMTVYNPAGSVFASVHGSTPDQLYSIDNIAVDAALFGAYDTLIDDNGQAIGIHGIARLDNGNLVLGFVLSSTLAPGQNDVLADGNDLDMTRFLARSLIETGWSAVHTATLVDDPARVPEPASLALALAAIGALAAARRRRA